MRLPATLILLGLAATATACNLAGLAGGGGDSPDAAVVVDQAVLVFPDEGTTADLLVDVCSPGAGTIVHFGPPERPFALWSEDPRDPLERDSLVERDADGHLVTFSCFRAFNSLWVPNLSDLAGAGSLSKLDSRTVREVARYPAVTCSSNKLGSRAACDGTKGCCSADDPARYQARKAKQNEPPRQPVQLAANSPARIGVDYNGDAFLANEALGGQGSVTKVANDVSNCLDRNHSGRIDTSKDTNGDGFIQTDCNGDGVPDDIASVQARPCTNKLPQEYYGLDDECVLWTSNVFAPAAKVRALSLAQGANDANVSDAWAGAQTTGAFVRLDGTTGLAKDDVQLPADCTSGTGPYGLVVDASGIGWVAPEGPGKLCYFDTKNHANVGVARDPQSGPPNGYGITMDRDQNVWLGGDVARYTPDRSNGFKNLGNGWWTLITGTTGLGIDADSRNANTYFVYSCSADQKGALQIPASTIKIAKMDQLVAPHGWPTIAMPCRGVSIDATQNVWGFDATTSTRALVDKVGAITQPKVKGAPMGNNLCPAGDSCPSEGGIVLSHNAGYGLRNGTCGAPQYQVIVPGCRDSQGNAQPTEWGLLTWDATVPLNTALEIYATTINSPSWQSPSWSGAHSVSVPSPSPVCLRPLLVPNSSPPTPSAPPDSSLQLTFIMKTQSQSSTVTLNSFSISYRCTN